MSSTPSSQSSISHNSPSSPSISIPSLDANVNAIAHAYTTINANLNVVLHPPAAPSSSACAACKYQRRKCGSQCMLAPYFPPERQHDFQNAHRLFGVSNIVKKLRKLMPSKRQKAIEAMVIEANMHAFDPSGGCHRIVINLQNQLKSLSEDLEEVQAYIAFYKDQQVNSETDLREQPYAGQDKQENQPQEQQLHDYFYFDGNLIDVENNNNTNIGGRYDITYNYLSNNYNHNEVEQEADRVGIRLFMNTILNCPDNELGEEQLVYKDGVDMNHMTPLNSSFDQSVKCSLDLGF